MKKIRNKNINELLHKMEENLQDINNLEWIKKLKEKAIKSQDNLKKLSKKEALENFKDNLIKFDNSLQEDKIFIENLKSKANEKRNRKAS